MAFHSFAEEQVADRIRFENPWWYSGTVEEYYGNMTPRLYLELFEPLVANLSVRRAVILMGPRRVGKTVMLYHTIQHLLRQGQNPHKVAFLSIDTPIYNNIPLEQLFRLCTKTTGENEARGWFMFFDEIQYLKDWEVHLKSLVDSYPETRFVVSGSAAAALKLKSSESGAGRFTEFMLPPLTFNEYLHLLNLNALIRPSTFTWNGGITDFYDAVDIRKLNEHFLDYINFGGYPEVIFSEAVQADPGRYIRSDIIDKVLLRDLPGLYGIKDVAELNSLFTAIAYNSGQEFSLESLSTSSGGVDKNTLKRYIEYLEAAFLVRTVKRTDNRVKRFRRSTQFKMYLTNPSLRSALFSPLHATDDHIGAMVETAVFSQWMHRDWIEPWYARWSKGEVDLICLDEKKFKPLWAVEIKWSNRYFEHPAELKSLFSFCATNQLQKAVVTTIDKQGLKEENGLQLTFVPASVYAYVVGRNTLIQKKDHYHKTT